MKARVTDHNILRAITPINAVAYLESRRWNRVNEVPGTASVWRTETFDAFEVVLPMSESAPDYANAMSHVLAELEAAEQRSQLDIVRDLFNSGFDVVRISAESIATRNGSVRLEDGLEIFEQGREILLASACAAVQPRAVFHSRKPQQAVEYLKKARFGQTEIGSFVITILSPVAPAFKSSDQIPVTEEPFERTVTATLAHAVGKMVQAAEQTALTGFEAFQSVVKEGVSANLCEATANLLKANETSSLSVSVSWALNRPRRATPPISIPQSLVGSLEEAARQFRARDTLENYTIEGPVVRLQRDGADSRVSILANVEGVGRRVWVSLPEAEYQKAVDAHQRYLSVRLSGNVKKDGRSYAVFNPTTVQVVEEDVPDIFS